MRAVKCFRLVFRFLNFYMESTSLKTHETVVCLFVCSFWYWMVLDRSGWYWGFLKVLRVLSRMRGSLRPPPLPPFVETCVAMWICG